MAAIVDQSKSLDLNEVLDICKTNLPSYSIPVFLRIVEKIPQTGTFKIQKMDLQQQGFDINVVQDEIYLLDPRKKEYIKLTLDLYKDINDSKVRL